MTVGWTGYVLPSLIGEAFPIKKTVNWSAVKQDALSGKKIRTSLYTYPTYAYEISFNVLRTAASLAELQTLLGFINQVYGPTYLWGYTDPDDNSVTNQQFAEGNGSTTLFQLIRTYGRFNEPVFLLNGAPIIYVGGVQQTLGTNYNISATANVSFQAAPAPGQLLTWTGSYYLPCRFDEDANQFVKQMSTYFKMASLKFSTEKIDIVTTLAPPGGPLYMTATGASMKSEARAVGHHT